MSRPAYEPRNSNYYPLSPFRRSSHLKIMVALSYKVLPYCMTDLFEMKTDESGDIECIRRDKLTEHDIMSEIFGNMSASCINIFLKDKKLYIHQNDGGLDEKDKKAVIAKKISTRKDDTASMNGIGIRKAFDSICERCKSISGAHTTPVTLLSMTTHTKERMGFYFMESPSWRAKPWSSARTEDVEVFNGSNKTMGLHQDTPGTMWIVPLNEDFLKFMQ
jgi:hypothetical protein